MPSTSLLPSLVFVCPSNCGSGTRSEITAVSPSRKSSPAGTSLLEEVLLLAVVVERPGEGRAEAGDVGAAFSRADVVHVGMDVLGELAGVLDGDFQPDPLELAGDGDDLRVGRLARPVEIFDELEDPVVVLERLALVGALVAGR